MNEFRTENTQDYTDDQLAALNTEWAAIVAADGLEAETDEYADRLDRFETEVSRRPVTTTYYADIRDDQCNTTVEIEAESIEDAQSQCESEAEDWCRDGEWGDDGAAIDIRWTLYSDEAQENEVEDGACTVTIEPNHDALIKAAGGDPDCDHEWSSEGEGGCDENPGVWSTGGTSMVFVAHCTRCGLRRTENSTGSQRNPGDHDTVEYEQPEEVAN